MRKTARARLTAVLLVPLVVAALTACTAATATAQNGVTAAPSSSPHVDSGPSFPPSVPSTPLPSTFASVTEEHDVATPVPGVPSRFTIWTDQYQAKWIGQTATGFRFYVGVDFDASVKTPDAYAVLFLWTAAGRFSSATIIDLGPTDSNSAINRADSDLRLTLGGYKLGTIHVQPFAVDAFGFEMGFIPVAASGGYPPSVQLLPADDMAFHAPWSYGHYDT